MQERASEFLPKSEKPLCTEAQITMTIERGTFEALTPSQFITFTIPNPFTTPPSPTRYADLLRIAVLDSHLKTPTPPKIAAMLVPINREDDWIFSTEPGHVQLLSNHPSISRLILVGNPPGSCAAIYNRPINDLNYRTKLEERLAPLILALSPKSAFRDGVPEIPFMSYEDGVVCSVSVDKSIGFCAGEMLVEDVEIEIDGQEKLDPKRECRRRLRFKRMPNLVQTDMRLVPDSVWDVNIGIGQGKFRPDSGCLVHPYLLPMVASLSLIAKQLEEQVSRPRILCVGVGGGALLSFLQTHFGFEVFGVESDEMVVGVAKKYFGLVESELLRIHVGDGIEVLEKLGRQCSDGNGNSDNAGDVDGFDSPFDVIMVDLDASDARNGLVAPPLEFLRKSVLLSAKSALYKLGILVVNVIPENKYFYDCLIHEFKEVFSELYEINVGNDENYVLISTVSPIRSISDDKGNSILKKLNLIVSNSYIDCIRRI